MEDAVDSPEVEADLAQYNQDKTIIRRSLQYKTPIRINQSWPGTSVPNVKDMATGHINALHTSEDIEELVVG